MDAMRRWLHELSPGGGFQLISHASKKLLFDVKNI